MQLVSEVFSDIEQIGELARDWDLEFRQTQAGALSAQLLQSIGPDFQFGYASFSRCVQQEGIPPAIGRTFAVLQDDRPIIWCGREVGFNDLMVFHPTAGFSSLSPPDFGVYTISISDSRWLQLMHDLLGWDERDDFRHERVLQVDSLLMQRLRQLLTTLRQQALVKPLAIDIHDAVIDALVAVLAASQDSPARHDTSRSLVVRKCHDFLKDAAGETLVVEDLCEWAGVSERTLQYAFKKYTGQSPKAFIRSFRLTMVRKALASNVNAELVSEIAGRWGFRHMGQFARDYRAQYGELPSETISI